MSPEKFVKAINFCFCILVILVPLIYFPTSVFPFNIIKTVVLQILAEIIFALWLGLAIFHKKYRPRLTSLVVALTIFIVVLTLSSVFGVDWRESLWSDEQRALGLVAIIHFVALFVVAASLRKEINWENIWFFSFTTAVAVSVVGILQKFIVVPRNANHWIRILYSGPLVADRIGSTTGNSSFLAGYLIFNFFIGLWLFKDHISRLRQRLSGSTFQAGFGEQVNFPFQIYKDFKTWFFGTGTFAILIAIVLTQTLGAFFALTIGILYLLVYSIVKGDNQERGLKNPRYASVAILILLFVFAAVFFYTKEAPIWQKIPGLSRVAQASRETPAIHDRLLVWRISLEATREKPILGWGLENFRIAYDAHYNPSILRAGGVSGTNWDKPHNVILEYLAVSGILGLLAYLGIFGALFFTILRWSKKEPANSLPPILGAMFITYFFQNLFLFDTIVTYLMFFLAMAFVDSRYQVVVLEDEARPSPKEAVSSKSFKVVSAVIILAALVPIYYSYQIFNGSWSEYWGINYLLNRLPESSILYFSQALGTPTPYIDDVNKNFANTVRTASQQGIHYENVNLDQLQGKIVDNLHAVIDRHPLNFQNYITLAEFEEKFYQYNPGYLDDAKSLLEKALKLSPERQEIYYPLAKIDYLKGNKQTAYDIFKHLIDLNPDVGEAHFYFGLMAYSLGDAKTGSREIAIAEHLGRKPATPEELITLANYVGDYDRNYKKAIELYSDALIRLSSIASPETKPNILLKLAVAYYFDHDIEKARQTFIKLEGLVDLKNLPIYGDLMPVLKDLKILK